MRIAIAQIEITGDVRINLDKMKSEMRVASKNGADIILFPECALTGYLGFEINNLDSLDPRVVHEAIFELQDHCKELGIGCISGQYFKRCGSWYNNAVAIGRDGKLLVSYDKYQLVDLDCYHITPGQTPALFEFDGATCSIAICHDVRYPEVLRQYGAAGSQFHFHLFYGARERGESAKRYQSQYDAQVATRAVENGFFVFAANATLDEQMVRSQARDPEGQCIAIAPSYESITFFVEADPRVAGDGWAKKRRDDLFTAEPIHSRMSYFERGVWEHKRYMITHRRGDSD